MAFWRRSRPHDTEIAAEAPGGDERLSAEVAALREVVDTLMKRTDHLRPIVAHLHREARAVDGFARRLDALEASLADRRPALDKRLAAVETMVAVLDDTDQVSELRVLAAKLGAEIRRLDVNVACRIDHLRDELHERTDRPAIIDLTRSVPSEPTETGWTPRLIG